MRNGLRIQERKEGTTVQMDNAMRFVWNSECGEFLVAEFLHFCLVSASKAGNGPLSSAGEREPLRCADLAIGNQSRGQPTDPECSEASAVRQQ